MNPKNPPRASLLATSALSVLVFLAIWELVCRTGLVDPIFLPPPSAVLAKGWAMAEQGTLLGQVLASARRVMTGFLAAALVAIPLGIVLGTSTYARAAFDPLLSFLRRYNMEVPADLAPARPKVMVVAASPERLERLQGLLSSRYDVVVQPDAVAGLAELGMLSAGAGLIDAAVVSLPAQRVDDQRWLEAVLRHPDTRYTRVVTVGGDSAQKHRWQAAGVVATVDPDAIEQVAPVLDQALGLVRR